MPLADAVSRDRVAACADAIARTAHELAARGWTPATSGNFSQRLDATHALVTASGCDKGNLTRDDFVVINVIDAQPLDRTRKASAEALLHAQIYRRIADADAVLHTHSRHQSVASRVFADAGRVRFTGWELQKAIDGIASHADVLELPVFPNTQHMPELAAHVDAWLDAGKPLTGYLIAGHGMYAFGRDMAEARRHLEAYDFLLACELDLKRLSP